MGNGKFRFFQLGNTLKTGRRALFDKFIFTPCATKYLRSALVPSCEFIEEAHWPPLVRLRGPQKRIHPKRGRLTLSAESTIIPSAPENRRSDTDPIARN